MTSQPDFRFGVDFVTLNHPGFWGCDSEAGIRDIARADPAAFWDKALDTAAASGVTGIELTFSPFHWSEAVSTFGSVTRFAEALGSRNLSVASGFFSDLAEGHDLSDRATTERLLERARRYAEFLSASGADVMAAGLTMRQTLGDRPARIYDLAAAQVVADFVNKLGVAVADHGVRLALHTESHSIFAMPRDIDLMMMLTDPAYVHFCPDSSHILIMGGDPVSVIDRYRERIVLTHWKDAIGPMPADTPIDADIFLRHQPYFCDFGAGRVDWKAWLSRMRDRHALNWHILELDAAADPAAAIRKGIAFFQTLASQN
ncbi:sugar phosphate isomerase/epimerase [Martelella sp. HB161492]|uniref:sugar phosphate isomerase/epimerase family protein n=1 Tax=Martelella sp. HB161492 TaxID=2720726 RepID=UPI001591668D|nr:sugar phosphate isomerase/epimerase [Martelella sp. HB161492]